MPQAEQALPKKLALKTAEPKHPLLHLPSGYTDYTAFYRKFPMNTLGQWICLQVSALEPPTFQKNALPPRMTLRVTDGAAIARITVFGAVHSWHGIAKGSELLVRGKLKLWNDILQIEQAERTPPNYIGQIAANYSEKKNTEFDANWIRKMTRAAITIQAQDTAAYIRTLFDHLSDSEILAHAQITGYKVIHDFLTAIHRPETMEQGMDALEAAKRLAAAHLIHEGQKQRHKHPVPASTIAIDTAAMQHMIKGLPFTLTPHQYAAVQDMVADLASPFPMFRLISGDVNTGKTCVFGLVAALVHLAGKQAAILAPNILLAHQIAQNLRTWFTDIPVLCVDAEASRTPDLTGHPILVGTTAMFSRLKHPPNFLVVDEQQKLSRTQRDKLLGEATNSLESTATCIPRTAALVSHGGMDYSILNQAPVQRRVVSRVIEPDDKQRLLDHVRKVVAAGGQVAVIYPAVNAREGKEKRSVEGTAEIWERNFPDRTITLHGKMSDTEKQSAIEGLKEKRYDIIVSTIILEVGLTLPSLRALIAVEADRFGVSQLHQLRGRVARAGGTGYFFALLPEACSDDARTRLKLLEENDDGYTLADRDLELRGFGDLSADALTQHGKSMSGLFAGLKLSYKTLRDIAKTPGDTGRAIPRPPTP